MRPLRLTWPVFLAAVLAAQACAVGAAYRTDPTAYLYGDSGLYAAAADSLFRDGDLDLLNQCFPGRATLADALPELEGEHGGEFGLAKHGKLTLKQSPVLAVAALPFYALLGPAGFLAFNLAVLTLLLVGVAELAGGPGGRVAALLLLVTTPLVRFAFNYSPDLFLTALLVGGLLAARAGRPLACGLLLGLAVGGKLYVAALALPVALLAVAAARPRWRAAVLGGLGGGLGLAPGAGFNAWQFGAPWATGYERQLLVENGTVGVAGHATRFTRPPLDGLADLLFDGHVGLVPTAPLWVLSLPAAAWLVVGRRSGWAAAAAGVGAANFALFAAYDGWHGGSAGGNRYLFPALACGFALIGAAGNRAGRRCCASRAGRAAPLARIPGE